MAEVVLRARRWRCGRIYCRDRGSVTTISVAGSKGMPFTRWPKPNPQIHHLERTLPSAFRVSSLHQPRWTSAAAVQPIDADEAHVGTDDSLVGGALPEVRARGRVLG
jgi:hypothetical protein